MDKIQNFIGIWNNLWTLAFGLFIGVLAIWAIWSICILIF